LKDILRANILTPFNALLGSLALVVLATGNPGDALFGLVIVWNSLVGIVQELRAKRTLDQLAVLNAPLARAARPGGTVDIPVAEVVLADILLLRAGDQVVADGVVRLSDGLEVDESLLTGESDPVAKQPGDEVLSGSIVVAGSATVQVHRVGADSFASRLTADARTFRLTTSELVNGINRILRYTAVAIVVTAPILFYSQTRSTATWQDAVRGTVAGLVGMVPEGLVLLTSITFFAAALTLARRRVLVQELPAVEGLARVDVMCLDKTGTLTAGEISFAAAEPLGEAEPELDRALGALAADEDANATLLALRRVYPAPDGWTRRGRVPFSSARKWSAASFEGHGTWVLGAPEIVWDGSGPDDEVTTRAQRAAAAGSRTLLVATTDSDLSGDARPAGLRPVALLLFDEAVRPDARATLRYFTDQGVSLKVISGDNPRTVGAVARRVGLPGADQVVDARQLPDDPERLAEVVDARTVFGRVTPQQKRAMVGGLHAGHRVVAMTGDGVNDALALKDADIGVAMGGGAAATRAVAQLVLLDNQFSVMPGVVAEGRRVIGNIERVAKLFLTKNVSALLLSLSVAVARWPFPFLPRHLTLVSAFAIGIPGFFLALGPSTTRFETGFVRRVLSFAVPAGTIVAVAVMIAYGLARAEGVAPDRARTAATITYTVASLWVLVMQARPLRTWKLGLVASMCGLAALAFVVPAGRSFFDLRLPPAGVVLQSLALGAGACLAMEAAVRLAGWIHLHRSRPALSEAAAGTSGPGGAARHQPAG
jgi:cation-transporting ATPase E